MAVTASLTMVEYLGVLASAVERPLDWETGSQGYSLF